MTSFLQKGGTDPAGREVAEIYWTTNKYQIYSADNQIRCCLPDDYETAKELRQNLYVISTQRATLEGLREHPAIRDRDKEFAARMLARCMAQAFEGHAEQALLVLQRVETRMASIIRGYYRMKYATATAGALIFVVIVLLVLVSSLHHFKDVDWFPLDVATLAKYAKLSMLGAIGAFLSVSLGIRRIWIDVDLDAWQHFYAGCSRIIIGVIGALAVGLALDSRFLSPGFGSELNLPVYYFLAFIAGFSETLVPNTLRRAEGSASQPEVTSRSQ